MSPVPAIPGVVDFPKIAREALDCYAAAGMHVVISTDEIVLAEKATEINRGTV